MTNSKWLAGAFSAYGLADTVRSGRRYKISLMTSSDAPGYVQAFHEQAGIGRVNLYRGRWHWVCDEPAEVQTFYNAVGEHLISDKKKMIEVAWAEWRRQTLETTEGEQDPGSIDGPLYPELQQDDDIAP